MNDTVVSLVWKCIRILVRMSAQGNLTDDQRQAIVTIAKYVMNRHPS